MKKKHINNPDVILSLLEKNLGNHKWAVSTLEKIKQNPEILEALLGELNASIYKFNHLKNESIIKNTQHLIGILGQTDLPMGTEVFEQIVKDRSTKNRKKSAILFTEMNKFKFLNEKTTEKKLIGRIILALYRTYLLQTGKGLREKNAQIASTIEEMLAMMALEGFDTHLFQATKHWILDWKREGFSRELAEKISKIKDQSAKLS